MKNPSSKRLINNEILARKQNSRFKLAMKKYFRPQKDATGTQINFNCECSDLTCTELVRLSISEYESIHRRNDRFILKKGHVAASVEKIVRAKGPYAIVEKFALGPGPAGS